MNHAAWTPAKLAYTVVLLLVMGGWWVMGRYFPDQARQWGLGFMTKTASTLASRDTDWYTGQVDGKRSIIAAAAKAPGQSVDFDFQFTAKRRMVLSDLRAVVVTSRNEKGRRLQENLASQPLAGESLTLQAGQRFSKKGTVHFPAWGVKGQHAIAITARLRYPGETFSADVGEHVDKLKADEYQHPNKYRLYLSDSLLYD